MNIAKLALAGSAVCLLTLSLFMVPVQAASMYAYITANPTVVEKEQISTLTASGYIYGSGTYNVNVEFWDSDQFEDIPSTDDRVGDCKTTVSVKEVGSFTCTFNVTPSKLMAGNIEDEADWVEFYVKITTTGIDDYKTSTILVYCSWCSGDTEIKKGE